METVIMSEKRLYDAALKGDTGLLLELLAEDQCLLDRVSYSCSKKTPLHMATANGHLPFVSEVLRLNRQLAEELDAQQSSPLHVASGYGHVEIVRELLEVAPDMCLSRDCQGWNPVHVAVVKERVEVLEALVEKCPAAAREKADRGLSVMHLCVKFGRFEALKVLLQKAKGMIDWTDDEGDNILHMGVRSERAEIVEYLIHNTEIDVHAKNFEGQTPMDLLDQIPQDGIASKMRKILIFKVRNSNKVKSQPEKWLTKKRDAIMVVAILIATMAFQAAVSPPGGVWQEDLLKTSNGSTAIAHKAGQAVMAYNHPKKFKAFMRVNTVAFVSSLSTILLLISGLPFKRKLFMWILMVIMWLTITSTAATYAISIAVVTPRKDRQSFVHVTGIALFVWCGVMVILFVGNTVRLIDRWLKNKGVVVVHLIDQWLKNKGIDMSWPRRFKNLPEVNHV